MTNINIYFITPFFNSPNININFMKPFFNSIDLYAVIM